MGAPPGPAVITATGDTPGDRVPPVVGHPA
ncbi:hypothetical protein FHS29_002516 [Saccharothrix tamanrassetensis]|uniref:Uncharacterized protein n=1 Tax=Saccharothrix tamanrassetensis TaxID=1051531 RepID=A0A841CIV4_9PSEU|nr:hypothetical protein [Saccharothrix tamanrassetensis]